MPGVSLVNQWSYRDNSERRKQNCEHSHVLGSDRCRIKALELCLMLKGMFKLMCTIHNMDLYETVRNVV